MHQLIALCRVYHAGIHSCAPLRLVDDSETYRAFLYNTHLKPKQLQRNVVQDVLCEVLFKNRPFADIAKVVDTVVDLQQLRNLKKKVCCCS